MSYVPVPNTNQTLGQTRDQIRDNIGLLKSSIAVNHYDLGTANVGKHKYVVLPVEASAPTTAAGEGVLYTKTVSGISRLFYTRDNSGTEIQLTGVNPTISGGTFATFLPGNFTIQGGVSAVNPNGTTVISLPQSFTSANYTAVITPVRNASNVDIVYLVSLGLSSFTVRNTSGSITSVSWVAIGR